ncbi:unnamed protein product [Sphenostylis stenocarpa]|uniref:Uncharacterized protein n=1 Tax=Sphenostylis stenocarpa TaxID=92480 RepID=A0AA86RL43_9FABA|nr:unnamed protein product [Sphenostylis stenocarpa]
MGTGPEPSSWGSRVERDSEDSEVPKICVVYCYCFGTLISYAYVSNTTRAGYSRADQFYASYPAGTELLTDTTKLHLETASKLKSGVSLSTASWRNTSSVKGSRHMLIMRYDAHMHAYDAEGRIMNCFNFNFCMNATAKKKILKEDCKSLLSSKAWYLEKAHGFNFFPGTQRKGEVVCTGRKWEL